MLIEISHAHLPEKLEIQEEVQKFLEKYEERWKISSFRLDVKTYSPEGRKKYSMHARVIAFDMLFTAKSNGWDIPSALSTLFKKLERMVGKKIERAKPKRSLKP